MKYLRLAPQDDGAVITVPWHVITKIEEYSDTTIIHTGEYMYELIAEFEEVIKAFTTHEILHEHPWR